MRRTKLLLSSALILLPIPVGLALWDRGMRAMPIALFAPPLILLGTHWLCLWLTSRDPKNRNRNQKPRDLVLWIMPVVSILSSGLLFSQVLGWKLSGERILLIALGVMFLVIGNYLPKCRQNHTIGIKVPWSLASEENWNATHRFAGPVWMAGGLATALSALLPTGVGIPVAISGVLALSLLPILYSWLYYRRQLQNGADPLPPSDPKARLALLAILGVGAAIALFVAVMLFTGSIRVSFGEESFTVEASYYDDLTVDYDRIGTVEYREGDVDGSRTWGVGSFRLLLGFFQNQEFGSYTRYTYYRPQACVILTVDGKTLVLSGKDAAETQAIYRQLLEHREG